MPEGGLAKAWKPLFEGPSEFDDVRLLFRRGFDHFHEVSDLLLEGCGESVQLLGVGIDGFQFWISDCFGGCCRRFWLLSWLRCGRRRECRNC